MDEHTDAPVLVGRHRCEWITCKGCGKRTLARIGAKGFCSRGCANRARSGPAHKAWRGDEAAYQSLHQRVYTARGRAAHCERCGASDPGRTYHWANLTGNYGDIWDYQQMCTTCHTAYDMPTRARGTRIGGAKLTETLVREARRRAAAGEKVWAMARDYGLSHTALGRAVTGRTWKHVPMED